MCYSSTIASTSIIFPRYGYLYKLHSPPTQTFSAYITGSDFMSGSSSIVNNAVELCLQRRCLRDRHKPRRTLRHHAKDAMTPSNTTPSTINPTPSTSPSTKQSSAKSRSEGRSPCSNELAVTSECSLWLGGDLLVRILHICRRDQDDCSLLDAGGSMMLSKSSLQTVFALRS